jgi:hypothetical protein
MGVAGAVVGVASAREVGAWVVVAGEAQAARREISNSVSAIVNMGLNKDPDPFRPNIIFFFGIVLRLL